MTSSDKTGSCHCGAVTWQALTPDDVRVLTCNCSLCQKLSFQHLIIPAIDFSLLTGKDRLSLYTFNTGIALHYFCVVCGVKSFYVPRSNPDGISLNLRCMDKSQFTKITLEPFDGQNWEDNAAGLSHLSETN